MNLLAYLVPGLPQLRRGEWFRGLVFLASAGALAGFLFWSNGQFLGLYGRLRAVAPRSTARELWAAKTARRDTALALFGLLFLASTLDAALGRRSVLSGETIRKTPAH